MIPKEFPQFGTKEFNDLASAYFGGEPKQNPHNSPLHKGVVISRFSFDECEPEIGTYVSLVWEDGSDCECVYNGLDKSILPLPTHWYYVK